MHETPEPDGLHSLRNLAARQLVDEQRIRQRHPIYYAALPGECESRQH